jgi:FkbM family methyltransferase
MTDGRAQPDDRPGIPPTVTSDRLNAALSQAYIEMVRLYRAGDLAGAQVIGARVQAELGGLVEGAYRAAVAHAAAGRPLDAMTDFVQAIELHRTNIANLELPVGLSACYGALSELYETMRQPLGAAAAARLGARSGKSFYAQPRGCQLPVLGGLYELMFGERADGSFVEVGAYDGETYGNTACLADLGWRGLYIEPAPDACERCRQRHAGNPKIGVVQCAIGAEEGTAALWQNGPCSTLSDEEHAMNLDQGTILEAAPQRIDVPLRRLDSVLAEAGLTPGFDLLVVDVDGSEEAVFAGFDMVRWQPRFLLIELIEDSPSFAGQTALIAGARHVRELIARHGYVDVINTIFAQPGWLR